MSDVTNKCLEIHCKYYVYWKEGLCTHECSSKRREDSDIDKELAKRGLNREDFVYGEDGV